MKRIILLAFLCTTTLVMAQRINHVQEAIANYDYEAALTLIAKEKPTIPLLLQKGKAQRGLGMNTEALSTYQEIITNDTANTRAYIEAAECCRSLAKYQQALKYYEQALDLNPENKYVRIQYIGLLLSLQKFQDALGESSLMTEKDTWCTSRRRSCAGRSGHPANPPDESRCRSHGGSSAPSPCPLR